MITWVLLTILLGTLPAAPASAVLLQVPAVDRDSREGRLASWVNIMQIKSIILALKRHFKK